MDPNSIMTDALVAFFISWAIILMSWYQAHLPSVWYAQTCVHLLYDDDDTRLVIYMIYDMYDMTIIYWLLTI